MRNLAKIEWKDFSMVLMIAEKLNYDRISDHPELNNFQQVIA